MTMTIFYSATTGGFYSDDIHGPRTIEVPDPKWKAPKSDPSATAPLVSVPNPDCMIPADAVEITEAEHQALLDAQASGKVIGADSAGNPVASDPPPLTAAQVQAAKAKQAKIALDATDMVAIRCLKAGVAFPADWQAYCVELRAIVDGSSDALPTAPAYPAGT